VRRWLLGVLATFGVTAAIAVPLLTLAGSGSAYRTVRYPTRNRSSVEVLALVHGNPPWLTTCLRAVAKARVSPTLGWCCRRGAEDRPSA